MDDVKCTGEEDNILDCPHSTKDDCGRDEGAGVRCSGKMSCSSLLYDDKICSNEYDFLNSQVICKWMGFTSGSPGYLPRLGANSTTQGYLNLRCTGVEESPSECDQDTTSTCSSGLDAGVTCEL